MLSLLFLGLDWLARRRAARPPREPMTVAEARGWLAHPRPYSPSLSVKYSEAMSVLLADLNDRARFPRPPKRPAARGCITATSEMTHPTMPPVPPFANLGLFMPPDAVLNAQAQHARQPVPTEQHLADIPADVLFVVVPHDEAVNELRRRYGLRPLTYADRRPNNTGPK